MNIDPVCGMKAEDEQFSFEFKGKKYYFCSHGCLVKFTESPAEYSWKDLYDLIIIGGGPAGLTAAVYASISKIDTFLITSDIGGQAIDSTKIKNYMGFDFITGTELVKKFKDQFLNEHYLAHKIDYVIKINKQAGGFEIVTKKQERFISHAVIIATGMKKRKLGIPGEERLEHKGVSHSSVQDIGLFRGLSIVVIGGGNSGVQTGDDLARIGCKVILVTQGRMIADKKNIEQLKSNDSVEIYEGHDIIEILGESRVKGVVIQSEETREKIQLKCGGVFIQVGFLPNTEFCKDIVPINKEGEIIINPDCSTKIPGLFACGDVTNAYGKRIIIASGEGAKAILSVRKYLLDQKRNTVVK